MNGCLAVLTFFICLHNQLRSTNSVTRIKEYSCLKNVIHQIDSKNEWVLLLASFAAKLGFVFVLTMENAFLLEVAFSSQQKGQRFF